MSTESVRLVLPVPPSPNRWARHPMEGYREKQSYMREVWLAAVQQVRPMSDPPRLVHVSADLSLVQLRDSDNLTASLKWALDALKQRQTGEVRFRENISVPWGYFVDDGPDYLSLTAAQSKAAKRSQEFLRLEIHAEGVRRPAS